MSTTMAGGCKEESGVSENEIKSAAIAKAVELRALHAALMQQRSPNLRFPSPSPRSRHASRLSAHDYPVFTPSYDDDPSPEDAELSDHTSGNESSRIPFTDPHLSLHSRPTSKGLGLSRLFPRLKKKKNNSSNNDNHEVSQMIRDLKKEVMEANESRDAALSQAAEMKSSLKKRLDYLETYSHELKKSLKREKHLSISASDEAMMEQFLHMVSESRFSVKQLCNTLLEETNHTLIDNLLQPYNLSLNSKISVLEAIINLELYENFENCAFKRNGASKHLDPQKDRQARLKSFVALRSLSWKQAVRKGTKYYSEELSEFFDEKMRCIVARLGWSRPWGEQLLQAFFVAAKCVWLLHLLAHSFNQRSGIMRVNEDMWFDGKYMEDVCGDRERLNGGGRVKMMVMPGFYVLDRVVRCKVLCRYIGLN